MSIQTANTPTVLFINNSPQPGRKDLAKLGGGGKSLLGLVSKLPDFGWNIHVIVPGVGQFTDELAKMKIPHTVYPFAPLDWKKPFGSARGLAKWTQLFRRIRPNIIHANGFDLSRSFSFAAGITGIPYITHVRFPVDTVGARWTLRGLPKPAAFIFNSHAMKNTLWPMLSVLAPRSKPFVAHNAVDLDDFKPAPWPENDKLRIGIVANFAPFKRHEDFLRMAADMVETRQDLEFWVVGEDTQGKGRRAELEKLATDLKITSYVRFLGHRSDIPELMRQLHLLVVPSQFEPFGRVIIEAMACGRPVIGSNDGGIPEIIENEITGSLVPLGDYRGFAKASLAVLEKRERWETFSKACITSTQQRFSLDAHVKHVISIYGEVLSSNT